MDNAASQNAYGVFSRTIVERAITTVEEAQNRGNVEVARYGYPQRAGRAVVIRAGLEVGQLLTVHAPLSVNVSGSFLIRRLRMTWSNRTYTRYEVEFGDWSLDLARALRRISEMAKPSPLTQRATVAPGRDRKSVV